MTKPIPFALSAALLVGTLAGCTPEQDTEVVSTQEAKDNADINEGGEVAAPNANTEAGSGVEAIEPEDLVATDEAATTAAAAGNVTVGSKIDTEGALLCQITKLSLIDAGFTVQDKCSTGATNVVRGALEQGEIDMYPEYTGSAIYLLNEAGADIDEAVSKNAQEAYNTVKDLDAENGIVWLDHAPANNTWAIAMPEELAEANGLETMADFARFVNEGGEVKLNGSQEFVDRPDALPAFEATYGFELTPEQLVIVPGGNTTQTETAAAQGTSGINAAMAYGTDGAISALGLRALTDPEGAVAVYQPAITIREETLNQFPQIADIINPVFAQLDEATLSELNGRIAVNGEDAAQVAQDWLSTQ